MNEILKAASLVLMLVSSSGAQTKEPGEKRQLKGAVRSILLAEARPGSEARPKRASLYEYSPAGDLVEYQAYADDGSVSSSTVYEYDARGNCILQTRRNAQRESGSKIVQKFDDQGRKTEKTTYDAEGSLSSKTVFAHQADGSTIQTTDYFKKGAPDGRTVDKLDSNGRSVENNHPNRSKDLSNYSVDGTRTETIRYDEKGRVENRLLRTYDVGKRASEVSYYRGDGSRLWGFLYSYNGNGEVVKEEFSGRAGSVAWQHDYEYDAIGNWIKQTSIRLTPKAANLHFAPPAVTYRTITYYAAEDLAPLGERRVATGGEGGGDVLRGSALVRAEPTYPRAARKDRVFGTVIVEVTVDEEGNVISARATDGPIPLRSAAIAAARDWKFTPTLLSGFPVKVIGTVTFNFNP